MNNGLRPNAAAAAARIFLRGLIALTRQVTIIYTAGSRTAFLLFVSEIGSIHQGPGSLRFP